ncbi:MAG: hypothetical protein IJ723_06210 [Ruminococcus sp.]|nr:hypothetical protein [Ruminococcus sp.]
MDFTEQVKYWFFRLVLLVGTDIMGLVVGKLFLWVIASFLPYSMLAVKEFLISDMTGSVVAALTMAGLLALVFRDDGRKHAAYEDMDLILVTVSAILLLAVYFIPVIFYNPNDSTRVIDTLYYMYYFPCRWVMIGAGADIKTAVAVGIAVILGLELIVYNYKYTTYKKRHPFNFKDPDPEPDEDEAEENA